MLRRLGKKDPEKYIPYFPERIDTFIDMFMGTGVFAFTMEKRCKYVFANDKDSEIFNLYQVASEKKDELLESFQRLPVHDSLFQYWRAHKENDPIKKAVRFLMLSNFGYLGKHETLAFTVPCDSKTQTIRLIQNFYFSTRIQFMSCDFRDVLSSINFVKKDFGRPAKYRERAFVYADPPYLGKTHTYQEGFTEDDSSDLFDILVNSGLRFAMSEFNHPFILQKATEFGLHVIEVEERRNLKNRGVEILITNYEPIRKQMTMFDVLNQSAGHYNNGMDGDMDGQKTNSGVDNHCSAVSE